MDPNPRRRPGRPAGGAPVADRDDVLDAAERVIARDGSGASLDAIATEAGVTKPVVYARVGGRAALAYELANRLAARLADAAARDADLSTPDRDQLASFFGRTLQTLEDHRELFLFVTRGVADDSLEQRLFLAGHSVEPLADLLAGWRRQRGADEEVALPWAYGIVGMLNMVSLWWLESGDRPLGQLADQLADLVWPALA